MEIGGISNVGPIRNTSGTTSNSKVPSKDKNVSDSLEVSDFLTIRKSLESATPSNEVKFKELKQILSEKGKLEITEEQLDTALNNFIDEIFS